MARRQPVSPDSDASTVQSFPSPTYKSKKYESKSRSAKPPVEARSSRKVRYPSPPSPVSSSVYTDSVAPLHADREPRKTRVRRSDRDQSLSPAKEQKSDRDRDNERRGRKSARTPVTSNPYALSPDTPVKKKKKASKREADPVSPQIRIKTPVKFPRRTKDAPDLQNSASDYMYGGGPVQTMPSSTKRQKMPYLQPLRTHPAVVQQRPYAPQQRPPMPAQQESILHLSNRQPTTQTYGPPQQNSQFFQQETMYHPGPYLPSPGPYAAGPAMTDQSSELSRQPAPYVDRSTQSKGWFGAIKYPFDDSNQYGQLQENDPLAHTEQGLNEKQAKKPRKTVREWWREFKHKKLIMWAAISLLVAALIAVGIYFAITKATADKKPGTSPTGGAVVNQGTAQGQQGQQVQTSTDPLANLDPAIRAKLAGPAGGTNTATAQEINAQALSDDPLTFNTVSSPDTSGFSKRGSKPDFSAFGGRDVSSPDDSVVHKRSKKAEFSAFGGRDEPSNKGNSFAMRDDTNEDKKERSIETGRYHIAARAIHETHQNLPRANSAARKANVAEAIHKRHESRHTEKRSHPVEKRSAGASGATQDRPMVHVDTFQRDEDAQEQTFKRDQAKRSIFGSGKDAKTFHAYR